VVGPLFGNSPGDTIGEVPPPFVPGLPVRSIESLLPDDASAQLKEWVSNNDWKVNSGATFSVFAARTFFSAYGGTSSNNILRSSDGKHVEAVKPVLTGANNFVKFTPESSKQKLFFFGREKDERRGLFSVSHEDAPKSELVYASSEGSNLEALFVDHETNTLWFKASYSCAGQWIKSLVRSDGSTDGTKDLWPDDCENGSGNGNGGGNGGGGKKKNPPIAVIWSVLVLADLPMMMLASWALYSKKLPGLFFNLYGGGYVAIFIIYFLIVDTPDGAFDFGKVSMSIYTALGYLGLVVLQLQLVREEAKAKKQPEAWVEDLKTWAMVVVGWPFFVVWHLNLSVPFNAEGWQWTAFAGLTVLQMLLAIILSRSFPMVMGAFGAFEVSWKISYEIVEIFGSIDSSNKTLIMLAVMAAQGVGIIIGAVYYANQRQKIDETFRSLLLRCSGFQQLEPNLLSNP